MRRIADITRRCNPECAARPRALNTAHRFTPLRPPAITGMGKGPAIMTLVKLTPAELRLLDIQKARGIPFPDDIFAWREATPPRSPHWNRGRLRSPTGRRRLVLTPRSRPGLHQAGPDPADRCCRRNEARATRAEAKTEAHAEPEPAP